MAWSYEWTKKLDLREGKLETYPLQFANTRRLENNNAVYIFDETGSGKTISAGLMVMHYLYNNPGKNVLVLTVPSLIKTGQIQGKEGFGKLPFRELGLEGRVVYEHDCAANIKKHTGEKDWGLILLDEAHRYLEAEERRAVIKELHADKIVFLTATPIKRGAYNLKDYCDLADEILTEKVDRTWLDRQETAPVLCEKFDLNLPITRYFKDTINALEDVENDEVNLEKMQAIRKLPISWVYNSPESKIQDMVQEILNIIDDKEKWGRDKDSGELIRPRFVVFVHRINDVVTPMEEYLARHTERFVQYDGQNQTEKISYLSVYGDSANLKEYEHNGSDGKSLPDILIVTYHIAEAGVNLPGYDYVINYHIPAFPSAIEQRFGRIDRMGKTGTRYREIHMVYLLPGYYDGRDRNNLNYYEALYIFRHQLLSSLPAKNSIFSGKLLEWYMKMEEGALGELKRLGILCDTVLKEIAIDEKEMNDLRSFCMEREIATDDTMEMAQEAKEYLEKKIAELECKQEEKGSIADLLEQVGDKIFYWEKEGDLSPRLINAIGNAAEGNKGCARTILEKENYRDYVKWFKALLIDPRKLSKARAHHSERLEAYFEEQFNYAVQDVNGNMRCVGKFENIFTDDYPELVRKVFRMQNKKEGREGLSEEEELFCENCTEEWINTLPFFEMCEQFGKILYASLWTHGQEDGPTEAHFKFVFREYIFGAAYEKLKGMKLIPSGIAGMPFFQTVYHIKNKTWECSSWYKLSFHCFQNENKKGIMNDIIRYIGQYQYLKEQRELLNELEEKIIRKIGLPEQIDGSDDLYNVFFTDEDNWRKVYKYSDGAKWTDLLPYLPSGRGYKQVWELSDEIDLSESDLWTYSIFNLLMYGEHHKKPYGNQEWLKDLARKYGGNE